MPLFQVTVKQSKMGNGIRIERGMTAQVMSQSMSNPVSTNCGQAVEDAFMRIYGVSLRQVGALSLSYLDVQRIG